MQIQVTQPDKATFFEKSEEESSASVQQRVMAAQDIQLKRQGSLNNAINVKTLDKLLNTNTDLKDLALAATERMGLSARALHRAVRVARTIADLESSQPILTKHLAEAFGYRQNNSAAL